jgi:hypothetical protein
MQDTDTKQMICFTINSGQKNEFIDENLMLNSL